VNNGEANRQKNHQNKNNHQDKTKETTIKIRPKKKG
jgi:hypothetical protein